MTGVLDERMKQDVGSSQYLWMEQLNKFPGVDMYVSVNLCGYTLIPSKIVAFLKRKIFLWLFGEVINIYFHKWIILSSWGRIWTPEIPPCSATGTYQWIWGLAKCWEDSILEGRVTARLIERQLIIILFIFDIKISFLNLRNFEIIQWWWFNMII